MIFLKSFASLIEDRETCVKLGYRLLWLPLQVSLLFFSKIIRIKRLRRTLRQLEALRDVSCASCAFCLITCTPQTTEWSSSKLVALHFTATLVLINSSFNPLVFCWRLRDPHRCTSNSFCCNLSVRAIVMSDNELTVFIIGHLHDDVIWLQLLANLRNVDLCHARVILHKITLDEKMDLLKFTNE